MKGNEYPVFSLNIQFLIPKSNAKLLLQIKIFSETVKSQYILHMIAQRSVHKDNQPRVVSSFNFKRLNLAPLVVYSAPKEAPH